MTDMPPPPDGFDQVEYQRRQRSRARIMAVALIALVALFYFITIAKIGMAS